MDRELTEARRAASASPTDPHVRARLAVVESRYGLGIVGCEPDALVRVLQAPWVSTDGWACVRTGWREVRILRPGSVNLAPGFFGWMAKPIWASGLVAPALDGPTRTTTACLVGRVESELRVKDPTAARKLRGFNDSLVTWTASQSPFCVTCGHAHRNISTYPATSTRPAHYAATYPLRLCDCIDFMQPDPVIRQAQVFSAEHVRVACGVDPIELEPKAETESRVSVRVGTCHNCGHPHGRERRDGSILCWLCWRDR